MVFQNIRIRTRPRTSSQTKGPPAFLAACLLVFAVLCATGCRKTEADESRRIALPPFENLSGNPAHDWIGRALPLALRYQLRAAPRLQMLPVQSYRDALGIRSGEILHGYYTESNGRIELHAVLVAGGKNRDVFTAKDSKGVISACNSLAHHISSAAQPLATASGQALQLYAEALSVQDAAVSRASLEKALAVDPGFGPAYLALMRSLAGQGDNNGALAVAAKAGATGNRIPTIDRLEIAIFAASLRGNHAEQRKLLGQLARLTPNDAGLLRNLGEAELRGGRTEAAVEWLKRAAAAEPGFALGWNTLTYAQLYLGDRTGALASVQRYAQLEPESANPLDTAGEIHYFFGEFAEAAQSFLQADEKDRGFLAGGALYKAAWARLMLGDRKDADEIHNRFLKAREEFQDPIVPLRRAQWELATGHRREAFQRLSGLIADGRHNGDMAAFASAQLALWHLQMGERVKAREFAAGAVRLAQSSQAKLFAVLAAFVSQEPAPAAEWDARASRAFPDPRLDSLKQLALGYSLLYAGEFAAAAKLLQQRFEHSPDGILRELSLLYAWALEESGKKAEATRLLQTWAVPDPRGDPWFSSLVFPRTLLLHARVFEAQGKKAEAARLRSLFEQCGGDRPEMFGSEGGL